MAHRYMRALNISEFLLLFSFRNVHRRRHRQSTVWYFFNAYDLNSESMCRFTNDVSWRSGISCLDHIPFTENSVIVFKPFAIVRESSVFHSLFSKCFFFFLSVFLSFNFNVYVYKSTCVYGTVGIFALYKMDVAHFYLSSSDHLMKNWWEILVTKMLANALKWPEIFNKTNAYSKYNVVCFNFKM